MFAFILDIITFPGLLLKIFFTSQYAKQFSIEEKRVDPEKESTSYYDYTVSQFWGNHILVFILMSISAIVIFKLLSLLDDPQSIANLNDMDPIKWFLFWLGISFGIHTLPRVSDAQFAVKKIKESSNKNWWIVSMIPLVLFAIFTFFWGDVIFAFVLFIFSTKGYF